MSQEFMYEVMTVAAHINPHQKNVRIDNKNEM